MTRYQYLLSCEAALKRILESVEGARGISVNTVENVPVLGKSDRVYISRRYGTSTALVSILKGTEPLGHQEEVA